LPGHRAVPVDDVDLAERELAGVTTGEIFKPGFECPARPAPVGIEVEENVFARHQVGLEIDFAPVGDGLDIGSVDRHDGRENQKMEEDGRVTKVDHVQSLAKERMANYEF